MPPLKITPPLLPTACPWTTEPKDLQTLYLSPSTGAITIRTSLLTGWPVTDSSFLFFPSNGNDTSSLNNLGYSPYPLSFYLEFLDTLPDTKKPIIISITGPPADLIRAISLITAHLRGNLAIEINLSCPNIPSKPPPAETHAGLKETLLSIPLDSAIPIGLKLPPYISPSAFSMLRSVFLETEAGRRLSFLTSTNTLGGCLVLDDTLEPGLPGEGMGGMAGLAIHPVSLGNVKNLRGMLDSEDTLRHIQIIGVGGVSDINSYKRMRHVGASFIGIATALGQKGPTVFDDIHSQISD